MTATLRHVTFDCRDSYALSRFWEQVTGWREEPDEPNLPGQAENLIRSPDGSIALLFINVPEAKLAKNRVHLDLGADTTRDEEVDRLLKLGATMVADHRRPDGILGFVVLADPEGNEFCIEISDSEIAALPQSDAS